MEQKTKRELIDYIKPYGLNIPMNALSCIIMGALALIGGVYIIVSGKSFEIGTFLIIVAVILLLLSIRYYKLDMAAAFDFNNAINKLEQSGQLQEVLLDFTLSQQVPNLTVKMGQRYLFSAKTGLPIAYTDISRVYQYVRKTNLIENYRLLKVVVHGKTRTLCRLKLRGKSDEDVMNLLNWIKHKNPYIQIGMGTK